MRIGLLIYGGLESISGGYLYDRKLVGYLHQQGDQVKVLSLPLRNYFLQFTDNFSSALLGQLQKLKLDILLQDELNHPSLFWINRRLRNKVPYQLFSIVHHLRSSELRPAWQKWISRWVEGRYLETLDGFVFNSLTTQQVVQKLVGKAKPCVVAYPGGDRFQPDISPAQIEGRCMHPGPLRLVFLGNIIPRKGLITLISALNHLPKDYWNLSVVGSLEVDRAYAIRLRKQVVQQGLGGQVFFLGQIPDSEVARLLSLSHVLAVPSYYEGFGIVYLEGMGFGLPAVAASSGAAQELITHGINGFILPPGDTAGLAECLNRLAEDRGVLLQMSLAARRRFEIHPTWEASMGRLREFLQAQLR